MEGDRYPVERQIRDRLSEGPRRPPGSDPDSEARPDGAAPPTPYVAGRDRAL